MTSEFELIRLVADQAQAKGEGVAVGIGDDAAVLSPKPGHELVAAMDTLNAGVHFFPDVDPADLGYKSLAVNLSDLAAMGSSPQWALLSVSMPRGDADWLRGFMKGFRMLADEFGVGLVGGDTCTGPLSVTVTALGWVRAGQRLLRRTAHAGDLVVVSGELGSAAYALWLRARDGAVPQNMLDALLRPLPRVGLGRRLVGNATACIDISDGLVADLGHIASASGCGAEIDLAALPANPGVQVLPRKLRLPLQLVSGDDYELCFTWPAARREEIRQLSAATRVPLSVVGRMVEQPGIICREPDGRIFEPEHTGHQHFQ